MKRLRFLTLLGIPLALAAARPAAAGEWAWDAYGSGAYNGAVTLQDDLGSGFSTLTDPTGSGAPTQATAIQPPLIVRAAPPSSGGVFQLLPPDTPCDSTTENQLRWQRTDGQQLCHFANGGYQWVQLDGTIVIDATYAVALDTAQQPFGCQGTWFGGGNYVDDGPAPNLRSDGLANTAFLSGSVSGCQGLFNASDYCYHLTAHGHSDWFLPAPTQLQVVYAHRDRIAALATSGNLVWHSKLWTNQYYAEGVDFATGALRGDYRSFLHTTICMRRR
ncbi:hypothetical protein [Endothiovibrio diazotrophicus]